MSTLLAAAVGLPFLIAISIMAYAAITAGRLRRRHADMDRRTPHRDASRVRVHAIGDDDV